MMHSFQVLEALKGSTSTRPAIFAMSNPTNNGIDLSFSSSFTVDNYFMVIHLCSQL